MPGDASLTLTGQMGDVMKESATCAVVPQVPRRQLGLSPGGLDRALHVHVPRVPSPRTARQPA